MKVGQVVTCWNGGGQVTDWGRGGLRFFFLCVCSRVMCGGQRASSDALP